MRVEFDATLEEHIDVVMRRMARSPSVRLARWKGTVVVAVLIGFGSLLATGFDRPPSVGRYSLFGALALLAGMLHHLWLFDAECRQRARQTVLESGLQDGAKWEFELLAEGLRGRGHGTDFVLSWPHLRALSVEHGDVVFEFQQGHCIVRSRAFPSPEQRRAFVAEASRLSGRSVTEVEA